MLLQNYCGVGENRLSPAGRRLSPRWLRALPPPFLAGNACGVFHHPGISSARKAAFEAPRPFGIRAKRAGVGGEEARAFDRTPRRAVPGEGPSSPCWARPRPWCRWSGRRPSSSCWPSSSGQPSGVNVSSYFFLLFGNQGAL